ncbi:hypothetical protein E2C01_018676 [Portunus trituberculatus]|uniref:Uncharacterized protein n=1 Tax=Portunus trituberculatus TaxID=210409 RepID=A0A5B7DVV6_PORTR|nr:hypothetical protein [Portunus trituberculatus]
MAAAVAPRVTKATVPRHLHTAAAAATFVGRGTPSAEPMDAGQRCAAVLCYTTVLYCTVCGAAVPVLCSHGALVPTLPCRVCCSAPAVVCATCHAVLLLHSGASGPHPVLHEGAWCRRHQAGRNRAAWHRQGLASSTAWFTPRIIITAAAAINPTPPCPSLPLSTPPPQPLSLLLQLYGSSGGSGGSSRQREASLPPGAVPLCCGIVVTRHTAAVYIKMSPHRALGGTGQLLLLLPPLWQGSATRRSAATRLRRTAASTTYQW